MFPVTDTDALGNSTNYVTDTYGRITKITHPEGDYAQFLYDGDATTSRGNVIQTTNVAKDGATIIQSSSSYDAVCASPAKCNKPNSVTDFNGNVTSFTYDTTYGVTLTETQPAPTPGAVQPQTRYSYGLFTASGASSPVYLPTATSACRMTSSCANTADEVRTTVNAYSGNLQPTQMTKAAGDGSVSATTNMAYDNFGNLTTLTNPVGATTIYVWDAMHQKLGEIGPDPDGGGPLNNRATRTTYTLDGLVASVEKGYAPGGNWGAFVSLQERATTYDGVDRKIADLTVGGSLQTYTQYSYDNDNRLSCTAVRLNQSAFGTQPDACALGTAGSDGPDRITQNGYDAAGHLTSIVQALGTSAQRTYRTTTYGGDGEVNTDTDANGNLTAYFYDGFNRLIQTNYPNPSGGGYTPNDYEHLTYDNNSNIILDRRRDGTPLPMTYDALNRKTTDLNGATLAYDNLGHTTSATLGSQVVSMTYDALGRKTSESNNSLGTIGYGYDLTGARTRIAWPDGFSVTYARDATEEVTDIYENGSFDLAHYSYDDLAERTGISRGNGVSTSYGYDGVSRLNALSHTLGSGNYNQSLGFTRNAAGQITGRSSTDTAYDWTGAYTATRGYAPNGLNQLTTSGPYSLAYDARGNLTSDSLHSYGYTPTNQLTSYASGGATAGLYYDPLGRLALTSSSSAATTQFAYAGDQLLSEYDGAGNLLRRYVPGASGADDPIVWYEGNSTGDRRWLLDDERGSVIAVTNAAGALMGTPNTYDEYGNPGGSNQGRFQYTGQLWIPEIGLYHYKARTYSPTLGRFMQTDPIGYKSDLDLYAYVHDDPINGADPTGDADWRDTVADIVGNVAEAAENLGDTLAGMPEANIATPELRGAGVVLEGVEDAVRGDRATAQLARNVEQGARGEANTAARLGDKVAGKQVSFKNADGTRTRADFVTKDKTVVETKTGGAKLSSGQEKLHSDINAGRDVTPVGKNAENAGLTPNQPTKMTGCQIDNGCK